MWVFVGVSLWPREYLRATRDAFKEEIPQEKDTLVRLLANVIEIFNLEARSVSFKETVFGSFEESSLASRSFRLKSIIVHERCSEVYIDGRMIIVPNIVLFPRNVNRFFFFYLFFFSIMFSFFFLFLPHLPFSSISRILFPIELVLSITWPCLVFLDFLLCFFAFNVAALAFDAIKRRAEDRFRWKREKERKREHASRAKSEERNKACTRSSEFSSRRKQV